MWTSAAHRICGDGDMRHLIVHPDLCSAQQVPRRAIQYTGHLQLLSANVGGPVLCLLLWMVRCNHNNSCLIVTCRTHSRTHGHALLIVACFLSRLVCVRSMELSSAVHASFTFGTICNCPTSLPFLSQVRHPTGTTAHGNGDDQGPGLLVCT